nr:hypothetical protein [Tanacetum cinerariifolium]
MDNYNHHEHRSYKTHKCIDDKRSRPMNLHTYNNYDGQYMKLHLVSHVDKHYHQSFDCSTVLAHRQAGLVANIHNHSGICFHITDTTKNQVERPLYTPNGGIVISLLFTIGDKKDQVFMAEEVKEIIPLHQAFKKYCDRGGIYHVISHMVPNALDFKV